MLRTGNFIFRVVSNCTQEFKNKKQEEEEMGTQLDFMLKVFSAQFIGPLLLTNHSPTNKIKGILIIHRAEEELTSFNDS